MASIQTTPSKLQPNILEPKHGELQPTNKYNPDKWSAISSNAAALPKWPNENNDKHTETDDHTSRYDSVNIITLSNTSNNQHSSEHNANKQSTKNPILPSTTKTNERPSVPKFT